MTPLRQELARLARFALVGGSNTALTYVLFVLLSRAVDQRVAYTVVFGLGIAYSAVLTRTFVFRGARSARRTALFAGWNVGVYGVGMLVLSVLRTAGSDSAAVNGLVVLAVTAPLNYAGGRLLFSPEVPAR